MKSPAPPRLAIVVLLASATAFAQLDEELSVDAGEELVEPMAIEPFDEPEAPDAGAPLESFESFDSFEPVPDAAPAWQPTFRVYGDVSAYGAIDTRFDSPRGAAMAENVGEARLRARLGIDGKLFDWLRVVVEGRMQVRGATQRDFDRLKGFFEPMLGDAYVDVYSRYVDLRVGNQRIPLGANAALAPTDALNARDLRESALEFEDAMLPVFAVRAQGDLGPLTWLAAYAPFFTPHRYFVFGQDEGLLQPAFGRSLDNTRIDPSVEDFLQDRVLETERPPPFAGDVALRVLFKGRVNVGASWVWVNEKLPRVVADAELLRALTSQASAVSALNRLQAGETLYRGSYLRQHLFSLEASTLLGPGQLDVDVTYSPRQTFYDASFRPVSKHSVTWVASYSQASDSIFLFSFSYLGMAIPDIGAAEQLMLLEPATAAGAPHAAFFHLFVGLFGVSLFDKRLELSVRSAFEPVQLSFSLSPRASYAVVTGLKLFVAGEVFHGTPWSPFGYFDRNDRVLFGARYELF